MTFLFHIGFLEVEWVDILDIALVSLLLYNLYKLVKGTVAFRIFIGFLMLYLIYLVVQATQMELLTAILGQFMGVGMIAAVILFQQELRRFLLMIGETTYFRDFIIFRLFKNRNQTEVNVTPILEAMKILGSSNTGALIVLSRSSSLSAYVETGDLIDAEISKRLLLSIFNKYSPLHDGAVLVVRGRLKAARCILPVSENLSIPPSMGLRHRAGVGISEVTNTLVLIVSEETGQLSAAQNGVVYANLSIAELKTKISTYLQNKDMETSDQAMVTSHQ